MDAHFALLPLTGLGWAVEVVVSLIVSFLIISFGEFVFHAYFMHQRFLPAWLYKVFPGLEATVYDHQDLHHNTYFKQFNHEPDPVGRKVNMYIRPIGTATAIIVGTPFMLVAGVSFFETLVPALVFFSLCVLHRAAWNILHPELHIPQRPWWTKYTAYKYLARYHYLHHYLHHKGIHMNFNIVIPCADFVLGRHAGVLDEQNIREVKEYGYWY